MRDHDLVDLIRKLDDWPSKPAMNVKLVVIGADGRTAGGGAQAAWMMSKLGARRFIYEVTLDRPVEIWDAQDMIRPFLTNESTNLRFRLQVSANATNAERIAEALHHRADSPMQVLLAHVRRIIAEIADSEAASGGAQRIGNRILKNRLAMQELIRRSLYDRTGLTATIIFEGTPQSETVEIKFDSHPVSPKDAPHATVPLTVFATLEPTGETPTDPLPPTDERKRALLTRFAEEATRKEMTLHTYWYDPDRAADILRHRLNESLGQTGYRCAALKMQPGRPPVPAFDQVDASISWKGFRGRVVVFHLDAIMRMREDGAGRYHAAGLPVRRTWLAEKGEAALRSAMHGRDFYDLTASEQVDVGHRVKEVLTREALAIGHDVDPVAPDVRLPEKRWLTPQVLEIDTDTYATKNAGAAMAEFSASLEIRFLRIRPLVDYIDHRPKPLEAPDYDKAIEEAIRELVVDTLKITMQTIDTTDYYADWEEWDTPFALSDTPIRHSRNYVRNKLVQAVRSVLMSRLDAAEVKLQLNRVDGALGRIDAVIRGLGRLDVEGHAEPADMARQSEEIRFALAVRPGQIEPQEAAEVMRRGAEHLDREDILKSILFAGREFLTERTVNELRELNAGVLANHRSATMKQQLEAHIDRHIVRYYGFRVTLENATTYRPLSERVGLRGRSYRDHELDAMLDISFETLGRQVEASRNAAGHEARRIERLQAAIESNPRKTFEERETYLADLQMLDEARRRQEEDRLRLGETSSRRLASSAGKKPAEPRSDENGEAAPEPADDDREPGF